MGNRDLAHQPLRILPEYIAAQQDLVSRGYSPKWVLRVVDCADRRSTFLRKGVPWYKSTCPCYEGYWLNGSTGSVQCNSSPSLLPGIHHHIFCSSGDGVAKCPYHSDAFKQNT